MQLQAELYGTILFVTTFISAAIAITAWRRRQVRGARAMLALMLAMAWWSGTYALHWTGIYRPTPFFWLDTTYLGAVIVPTAFFVFSVSYAKRADWLKPPVSLLLAVEPLLTLIFLWTDQYHGLFFAGKRLAAGSAILDGGPWFWTNIVYSYALMLLGFVLLIQTYFRTPKVYRGQIGTILLGAFIPWVGNAFSLTPLNPLPNLDSTPILFTLTGVVFAFALFYYRFLDIVPVARDVLVDSMADGVLVIDAANRLIDINPAAQTLVGGQADALVGRDVAACFVDWPDFWRHYQVGSPPFRFETRQGDAADAVARFFDVRVVPLSGADAVHGRLVIMREITERKKLEQEQTELIESLQSALGQVKTLSGLLPICANCQKIRDDQGYWHRVEAYIEHHSEAEFSHSICPNCQKELYPQFYQNQDEED